MQQVDGWVGSVLAAEVVPHCLDDDVGVHPLQEGGELRAVAYGLVELERADLAPPDGVLVAPVQLLT